MTGWLDSRAPEVLHVDNHLLMLAKPAGMPCVPDESGDLSLLDWGKTWVGREFQKPGAVFLGVVHRLDRPVSGVVAFARTSKGAARLSSAFREHVTGKHYLAVLSGTPEVSEGVVRHFLHKDRKRNQVSVVPAAHPEGKEAHSLFRVLGKQGSSSLVELSPVTGRSHQLRVAMASLGLPILGDLRYGAQAPLEDKSIALHAYALTVPHPTQDHWIECVLPPPRLTAWDWVFAKGLRKGSQVLKPDKTYGNASVAPHRATDTFSEDNTDCSPGERAGGGTQSGATTPQKAAPNPASPKSGPGA